LFLLAGLEFVEEYGSFAKTAMDNSAEEMIILLRKASARALSPPSMSPDYLQGHHT